MKTVTFYSGKLWHSDKPFPAATPKCQLFTGHSCIPYGHCGCALSNISIQDWLSTAYEVVNPEVIPTLEMFDKSLCRKIAKGLIALVDGDQITLPEGYTLHIGRDQAGKATIDPPEKPENSAHGDCKECTSYFGYPMSKCFHCKPKVSEPSESQEEIMCELFQRLYDCLERGKGTLQNVIRDFTITRK